MKILILGTARSGSNWVYDSLVKHIAPHQHDSNSDYFYVDTQRKIPVRWNEPFSDSVSDRNQNWQACMRPNSWVIKSLAHHHTIHYDSMTMQAIRSSDCTVKLMRHPKSIVISTIAATVSNLWGGYSSHIDLKISQEQISHAVQGMLEETKMLHTLPCDRTVYYEDLLSSSHIYNSVVHRDQVINAHIENSKEFTKPNQILLQDPEWVDSMIDQQIQLFSSAHISSYPRQFDITRYMGTSNQ